MIEDNGAIRSGRSVAVAALSLGPRIAHSVLLAASLTGAIVTLSLWLTEPDLPFRTRAAFATLTLIGVSWAGYAAWVLTQRRVLYARQRVVAGWLAVSFTSAFTIAAFTTGLVVGSRVGLAAGAMGLLLVGISLMLLARARRRLDTLLARRRELETLAVERGQ